MAFNKPSGPPASRQQMDELVELLERAGHSDFRDARGPMGFTQRQANGKFTRDEAQEFIDQLVAEEDAALEAKPPALRVVDESDAPPGDPALRDFADEALAEELRLRGWTVSRG